MSINPQCQSVEPFLDAYVDGEFDAREAAELEAHLGTCHECARLMTAKSDFKAVLKRAAGASAHAPVSLRDTVRERLADPRALDELDVDAQPRPTRSGWRFGPAGIAAAAAIAGAAVWFGLGGLQKPIFHSPPGMPHPLVEAGVAMHARALPLDFAATDASAVQRWLEGRLEFGVQVPRFQSAAALQGVRLSQVRARPAAAFAYQLPQQASRRVTLLIVDDPDQPLSGQSTRIDGRDVFLAHARGYNVASWRQNEIVYSLISDLDEANVLELVKAAQER
jgi:anti-sigma factor (TIGR02949 family)